MSHQKERTTVIEVLHIILKSIDHIARSDLGITLKAIHRLQISLDRPNKTKVSAVFLTLFIKTFFLIQQK